MAVEIINWNIKLVLLLFFPFHFFIGLFSKAWSRVGVGAKRVRIQFEVQTPNPIWSPYNNTLIIFLFTFFLAKQVENFTLLYRSNFLSSKNLSGFFAQTLSHQTLRSRRTNHPPWLLTKLNPPTRESTRSHRSSFSFFWVFFFPQQSTLHCSLLPFKFTIFTWFFFSGRRITRRRFWSVRSRRTDWLWMRLSMTTTPSFRCTRTPWKSCSFSVVIPFSSRYRCYLHLYNLFSRMNEFQKVFLGCAEI